MTVIIRSLTKQDIPAVADVHSTVFAGSRTTRLGKRYLRKMYKWFVENQPHLNLVAEQDGQIIGFLTGAIGGYGRKIFRYAFWEIVLGFILHPNLIFHREMFKLWRSYLQGLNPILIWKARQASSQPAPTMIRAGLASIGVSQIAQGSGIGKKLVTRFEEVARAQGASMTALSVHADNTPARRLYESCGWEYVEKYSTPDSAYYIKYLVGSNENGRDF